MCIRDRHEPVSTVMNGDSTGNEFSSRGSILNVKASRRPEQNIPVHTLQIFNMAGRLSSASSPTNRDDTPEAEADFEPAAGTSEPLVVEPKTIPTQITKTVALTSARLMVTDLFVR